MARKLRPTPIGATVPRLPAVSGAVASVAPTDDAPVRHQKLAASARSLHRVNREHPRARRRKAIRRDPGSPTDPAGGRRGRWRRAARRAGPAAGRCGSGRRARRAPPPGLPVRANRERRRNRRPRRPRPRAPAPAEPQEPGEEVYPRRDQPDVKPRDGEQMHQSALTEAILQLGCDAASAAEHQRAYHPPAAAIQGRAGPAEEVANPVGKAGCRAHSAHPCDGERSFRASAPTGARHPAALDLALVSRSGRCTRGPSGRDHASTGDEWAKRGHPARPPIPAPAPGRGAGACRHHRAPQRACRRTTPAPRGPGRRAGAGPDQGDRMPNQHQRRADRGHAERTPEMQKAGRETGPVARRQQNGGPRLHRPRLRTDFDSSCRIAAPPRSSGALPSWPHRSAPCFAPFPG